MSFLNVFIASLVLTVIVGTFIPLTWRKARTTKLMTAFWGTVLLVHLAWITIPHLGVFMPMARWIAIMWLASMLSACALLIPVALLNAFLRSRKFDSATALLPMVYVACFLTAGFTLALTSTADFVVRQETVAIANLPADLDGFRIANLGDVHIGRFIDPKELQRAVQVINEQKVDLVVITGDLLDDTSQLESSMQVLEKIQTPHTTVAILGNHEEMGDLAKILSAYDRHKARVTLLVNQNIAITQGAAALHIVGVDYPMNPNGGHMLPRPDQDRVMSAQADRAFTGLTGGDTVLALSHHPAFFPFAAAHGAQLTLASHTHGGQLRLFGHPIIDAYPYLQGPYRRGESYLDVSAGFGHWLPLRFGVPRELVIITLRGIRS